ncbi:MAG: hypothetical protein ACQES9_03375 [Myxococcota bacterium]
MKTYTIIAISLFLTAFTILSCKSNNQDKASPELKKSQTSKKDKNLKKTLSAKNTKSEHKQKSKKKKSSSGKGILYFKLNLSKLMQLKLVQKNLPTIKTAATKNSTLNSVMSCKLDFTKDLNSIAGTISRNFKRNRRGAFLLQGKMKPLELVPCLAKKMNWKKISDKNNKMVYQDDQSILEFYRQSGGLKFKTGKWNHSPENFFQKKTPLIQGILDKSFIILGGKNIQVNSPNLPTWFIAGVENLQDGVFVKIITEFKDEKAAKLFSRLLKIQLVKKIKELSKAKAKDQLILLKMLKKIGIKRKKELILAASKFSDQELKEMIKIFKIKVTTGINRNNAAAF